MNETETESLVRDTFRHHEHLVSGRGHALIGPVRTRADRRRRTIRVAGTAAAVLAVLAGTVVGVAVTGAARRADPPPAAGPGMAGWRWESWLGAQVMVPGHWSQEDYGCGGTAAPSVVRSGGPRTMCAWTEPTDKELALLGTVAERAVPGTATADAPEPDSRALTIDGVAAVRHDFRLPDGRYAGTIDVPSRGLGLTVRTTDAATTEGILDSFRLVDVDHAGCQATRPVRAPGTGGTSPTGTLVAPQPASIAICLYHTGFGNEQLEGRLRRSTVFAGADAVRLAAALNGAAPGLNADPPARMCTQKGPVNPDALLLVRSGEVTARVWVIFSSCTGRGLDNGVRQAQLTMGLLRQIMGRIGFTMRASLPG